MHAGGRELMDDYDRLERQATAPKPVRDLSAAWERLEPLEEALDRLPAVRERVDRFCDSKRIRAEDLAALGTRLAIRGGGPEYLLAWTYRRRGVPAAIKYRNFETGRRENESSSNFKDSDPLIVGGDRGSLDWFIAEGETDAARLYGLVGDVAVIVCIGAGAKCFPPEWASLIPRGATVHLAHRREGHRWPYRPRPAGQREGLVRVAWRPR